MSIKTQILNLEKKKNNYNEINTYRPDRKIYAINHRISYDKYLPQNSSSLCRRPVRRAICNGLVMAGLVVDPRTREIHTF